MKDDLDRPVGKDEVRLVGGEAFKHPVKLNVSGKDGRGRDYTVADGRICNPGM